MATYRLETPQGEIVVQHPQSGLSLDQVLGIYNSRIETATAERVANFETESRRAFEDRVDTAEQIAMSREASLLDYVGEVPKGIGAGAANILESSLLGLASLAPEGFEDNILRPAIQAGGDAVQGYLSADYDRGGTLQDSAIRKLSEAGGSFAGILGASIVNPYLGVGVAVGAGAGEARERARAAGATREQMNLSTLGGGFVGALDVLPIRFLQAFGKGGTEKIIQRVQRVIAQGGVEAGQEAAASILQNAIAKNVYNPEQDLLEGTAEEAVLGGSIGAIVQTIVELATPRKRGGSTDVSRTDFIGPPEMEGPPRPPRTPRKDFVGPPEKEGPKFPERQGPPEMQGPPRPVQGPVGRREGPPEMQGPKFPERQGPPEMQGPPRPVQGPLNRRQGPPEMQGPPRPRQGPPEMQGPKLPERQGPPEMQGPKLPVRQGPPEMQGPEIIRQGPPRPTALTPVVKSKAEGKDLSALQNRLGEDDVQADETESEAGGDSVSTAGRDVVNATKSGVLSNADSKKSAEDVTASGASRVVSPIVEPRPVDGAKDGQPNPLDNPAFEKKAIEQAAKQNEASREILVDMPIADFLAAAKKEASPAKLAKTRKLLAKGTPFNSVPSLSFENNGDGTGTVVGHDGRNRAIALAESGVTTMPVRLTSSAGKGPSIRWGKQNDPTDRDYVETLPQTLIEQEGTAIVNMPNRAKRVRALQTIPNQSKPLQGPNRPLRQQIPGTKVKVDKQTLVAKGKPQFVKDPTLAPKPTAKTKSAQKVQDKTVAAKEIDTKLKKRWEENTKEGIKRDYREDQDNVKGNPFSNTENRKILRLLETPVKKTDKEELDAVVTYFGLYPNPAEGLYVAIIDDVTGSKQSRGDPLLRGTGGKAADKALAWAEANLDEQGKKWIKVTTAAITTEFNSLADADLKVAQLKEQGVTDAVQVKRDADAETARREVEDAVKEKFDAERFEAQKIALAALRKNIELTLKANAVVGLDIPMHPFVTSAINAGKLKDALLTLAATSPSPQVQKMARKLADVTGTTKLVIKKDLKSKEGISAAGIFDPATNTITLDEKTGINTHTLIHEMSHAAGSATLSNKTNAFTLQVTKLFNDVKGYLDTPTGTENIQEFFAEYMGNQKFRTKLDMINAKGEAISAGQRFRNIVGNYVRKFFGGTPVPLSALEIADSFVDGVLAPAPQYRNSGQLLMMSTPDGVKRAAEVLIDKTQKKLSKEGRAEAKEQFINDSSEFLRRGVGENAKLLLLRLTGSQGLADIAKAAGLQQLGFKLDRIMGNQRGEIRTENELVKRKVREVVDWVRTVGKAKEEALNNVIYSDRYGATIYQVDPTQALDYYSKFWMKNINTGKRTSFADKKDRDARVKKLNDAANVGKTKEDRVNVVKKDGNRDEEKMDVWQAQRKDWNTMGAGGQKTYLAMRDYYRKQYEKMREVIYGEIDDLMGNKPEEAKRLKNEVYARLFDRGTLEVYFPLVREGKYKLTYAAKNPTSEREAYIVEMFTTEREQRLAAEEVKNDDRFTGVDTYSGEATLKNYSRAIDGSFVADTLRTLSANGVKADVQEQVMRLFIDALPETSFAKSMQKRKGTPGFKQDAVYALKSKAYDLAGQTVKMKYGAILRQFEREVDAAEKPIDAAKAKKAISVAGAAEATRASFDMVKTELLDRAQFARKGAARKDVENIGRRLNQVAFVFTIGFNASSALVNLSQIPLFVLPYLAGTHGYKNTVVAIKEATAIMGYKNSLLGNYDLSDDGVLTIKKDADMTEGRRKELEELMPIVSEAMRRGQLGQGYLAEAIGLDESGRVSRKGSLGEKVGSVMDNVSTLSAVMFNYGEQYNRQITLITSYKLQLQAVKKAKNLDGTVNEFANKTLAEQRTEAANRAIYDTQQTNGGSFLETAPPIARESWGRVALMYKSYGLQMYYSMLKAGKIAFDSDKGKLFGKEGSLERKAAFKQLMGIHLSALFFAGAKGLPLYGAATMIANIFFLDEEEEDADTIVRKYIGEGWFKGAITEFAGISVADRVALTGLLLQENRFNNDPSLEENILFYLGGPALSVGKRFTRGFTDLYNGEFARGTENFLPAGLANVLKTTFGRYAQDGGIYTRRMDPIYDDMTGGELVAQMLGFPPTEYAYRQEMNRSGKRIDIAVGKRRSALAKKYYIAMRMYDYKEMLKIRKDMNEFSRRHPTAAIDDDYIERSMKQHMKTSAKMHNGISISPINRDAIEKNWAGWDQGFKLFD